MRRADYKEIFTIELDQITHTITLTKKIVRLSPRTGYDVEHVLQKTYNPEKTTFYVERAKLFQTSIGL